MENLILTIIFALGVLGRVLRPNREEPVATPSAEASQLERDFALYQGRLASQSRRLDSIDGTLVGLAALEFAAMGFFGISGKDAPLLYHVATAILGVMAALDILAIIAFGGIESPDLQTLDATLKLNRTNGLQIGMKGMLQAYNRNAHATFAKSLVIRIGTAVSGAIVLGDIIYRMVQ